MKPGKIRRKAVKLRIGIVVSLFNSFITERLVDGCLDELSQCGIARKDIAVTQVPGAFEIPVAALKMARKRSVDAVICLGAVIRGETLHFELVAQGCSQGIMQVALMTGKPVIFGVLASDTVNQAYARSKKRGENKGREAARAAVDMIRTLKRI